MTLLSVLDLKGKQSGSVCLSKSLDLHVKLSNSRGNNVAKAKNYGGQMLEEPHVA